MKKKKYKQVSVKWLDAWSEDDWLDVEDLKNKSTENYIVHTLGYLIHETKECIVVSQQIEEIGSMASMTMFIPRGMILEIRTIKGPENNRAH